MILSFSHELMNPLHSILGNFRIIEKKAGHTGDAQLTKTVTEAKNCLLYLHSMINNILDSSKIEEKYIDI